MLETRCDDLIVCMVESQKPTLADKTYSPLTFGDFSWSSMLSEVQVIEMYVDNCSQKYAAVKTAATKTFLWEVL